MTHSSPNVPTNLVKLGESAVFLCAVENIREKQGNNMLGAMSNSDAWVCCSKDKTSILDILFSVNSGNGLG
jgi:hypothetical protein